MADDTTTTDAARRVLGKLEERPDLLHEVLRLAHDEYLLAGPWTEDSRRSPYGEIVASINAIAGASSWTARALGRDLGQHDSRQKAQDTSDRVLSDSGWLLA